MVMDFKKETFIELKRAWELLHELPHTFNELGEDRGDFFGVTIQMATPREMQINQGKSCVTQQKTIPSPLNHWEVFFTLE